MKNAEEIISKLPRSYLSISQINLFLRCGYQYFYSYVMNMPSAPSKEMAFGSAGHYALEQNFLHKLNTGKDLEDYEVIEHFNSYYDEQIKQHNISLSAENTATDKIKAGELLRTFMSEYAPRMIPNKDGIEKRVEFKLSGIPLVGYVDFIGTLDGVECILDYKFVGRAKSKTDTNNDMQLTAYSYALGIKNVGFVSLVKGKVGPESSPVRLTKSTRCNRDIAMLRATVENVARSISNDQYIPTRASYICNKNWCSFWTICPSGGDPGAPGPKDLIRKMI